MRTSVEVTFVLQTVVSVAAAVSAGKQSLDKPVFQTRLPLSYFEKAKG